MNRRARRRARRGGSARGRMGPAGVPRRPLPWGLRLLLALVGAALVVGGIILLAQGGGSRAGRLVGAVALLGVALIIVAWQGRR